MFTFIPVPRIKIRCLYFCVLQTDRWTTIKSAFRSLIEGRVANGDELKVGVNGDSVSSGFTVVLAPLRTGSQGRPVRALGAVHKVRQAIFGQF